MSPIRISIEAFDTPCEVYVEQPGQDKPHRKQVPSKGGYEFMVNEGAKIAIGTIEATAVHPDSLNQWPNPLSKPHAGQTSATSSLQPETPETRAQREEAGLQDDDIGLHANTGNLAGGIERKSTTDEAKKATEDDKAGLTVDQSSGQTEPGQGAEEGDPDPEEGNTEGETAAKRRKRG
jgi:hypothetical protein